jgi:hypothetical protein
VGPVAIPWTFPKFRPQKWRIFSVGSVIRGFVCLILFNIV